MNSRVNNIQGFTLIEILIVLMVIGIVGAILFYNANKWLQATRLKSAAVQVVTDFQLARSQAQVSSQDSLMTLCSTAITTCTVDASNIGYTIQAGSTASTLTKQLPDGITLTNLTVGTTTYPVYVKYSAPYAETNAIGTIWKVTSPFASVAPLYIKIVSITGKVVLSASAN